MRVMYIAGNPESARTLEIEREINGLQSVLERGAGSDPIQFRAHAALPAHDLGETIRRFEPDVLQLSAHGHDDALVLAEPGREAVLLDGPQLAGLLTGLPRRPSLVIINACSSAAMAGALAKAGVAPFVIGTDAPITNLGARSMVEALYRRLAAAASIGEAFEVAAAQLAMIDGQRVSISMHPEGAVERAREVRLVDPLRVIACLPMIDEWIDAGLTKVDGGFHPELPEVWLGVAGLPAATRQTVLFTDDETVKARKGKKGDRLSLEEARSWFLEKQPDCGVVWMPDYHAYWGDMNWFAAVTTTDGCLVSCASTTCAALRRYYLEERWREPAPAIAALVEDTIGRLESGSGSRRTPKRPTPRVTRL